MEDGDLNVGVGESLECWKARTGKSKATYYRYRGGFVGKRREAFLRTKAAMDKFYMMFDKITQEVDTQEKSSQEKSSFEVSTRQNGKRKVSHFDENREKCDIKTIVGVE